MDNPTKVLEISHASLLPTVHIFRDEDQAVRYIMRGNHTVCGMNHLEIRRALFEYEDWFEDPHETVWIKYPGELPTTDHTKEG